MTKPIYLAAMLVAVAGCTDNAMTLPSGKFGNAGYAFPRAKDAGLPDRGGMTLRDYFAAHAPPRQHYAGEDGTDEQLEAAWRWKYADEMIRLRAADSSQPNESEVQR